MRRRRLRGLRNRARGFKETRGLKLGSRVEGLQKCQRTLLTSEAGSVLSWASSLGALFMVIKIGLLSKTKERFRRFLTNNEERRTQVKSEKLCFGHPPCAKSEQC